MQYRKDRYGNPISVLGYGCMRFTQTAGKIDIAKTEKEILEAFHGGVNYFDTAYIYPGSEAALGEILARNGIREQVNIATKLPHYLLKKPEDLDRYFSEELRRLKTDHAAGGPGHCAMAGGKEGLWPDPPGWLLLPRKLRYVLQPSGYLRLGLLPDPV